jgi:hypothetical protein
MGRFRIRGPFEAQIGLSDGVRYGPLRRRWRDAVPDAERLGPGAVVRNTRTGEVVWRVVA